MVFSVLIKYYRYDPFMYKPITLTSVLAVNFKTIDFVSPINSFPYFCLPSPRTEYEPK